MRQFIFKNTSVHGLLEVNHIRQDDYALIFMKPSNKKGH